MAAKQKNKRYGATTISVIAVVALVFVLGGCADGYYASNRIRSPEARYDTYYGPDYYPYFPWDSYYGGAYYYGE